MIIEDVINSNIVDFSEIPPNYYLLGLLSAFENRFQAMADNLMKEISWKQFFAVICINMCKEPPTLKELSDVLGSSHQNVKQMIALTDKCKDFCEKNDDASALIMAKMFDGISDKDIRTTIKTIINIEKNLRGLE